MEIDRAIRRVARAGSGVEEITRDSLTPHETLSTGRKLALFIDGENLSMTINRLGYRNQGKDLDFEKLVTWLRAGNRNELFQLNYYCTPAGETRPNFDAFLGKLTDIGFRIVQIPDKYYRLKERKPAPIDTIMSVDMVETMAEFDEAVLVSGDGDFGYAIEELRKAGKRVRVIAGQRSIGRELLKSGASVEFLQRIFEGLSMKRPERKKKVDLVLVVDKDKVAS